MRHYLLLIALSCCCLHVQAGTYYFSATSGNDSRSVKEAQNPLTPWETIAKLNAMFSNFGPGDSILSKRDEVFEGPIVVTRSGSASQPIVLGAYGTGEKPVITGFSAPGNWIAQGNNIWEAPMASTSMVHMVLVNGEMQAIGRYPNANAASKGYLTFEATDGTSQITDRELPGSPSWTGGEVVIRKARWVLDRNLITNHSGNTISYNSESTNQSAPGYGYFIQNHPNTLDVDGEWYYSAPAKKLGIYLTAPAYTAHIQASTVDTLVSISAQRYIVFDNLTFTGSNLSTFSTQGSQYIAITSCNLLYAGTNAVDAGNSDDVRIESCIIDHANNIAINGEGSANLTIRNNTISNTATIAGSGRGNSGAYEAVMLTGDNHLVEGNNILHTGYIPVTFRGNRNIIRNNLISHFAFVKDDAGGIYSWNNIPNAPATEGTKIISNTVLDGSGAPEGTDVPGYLPANGIYMDDNTSNVEITGNTVASNSLNGIYLHNAHEISISNNTVFNNKCQLVMVHDNYAANSPIRNITLQRNILFSKEVNQPVAQYLTPDNDLADLGLFGNNNYSRPISESSTIVVNSASVNKSVGLDEWKRLSGKDQSSTKSPVNVAAADRVRFEYNAAATQKTVSLDQPYIDVTGKAFTGSLSLAPFSAIVLIRQSAQDGLPGDCPGAGTVLQDRWDNVSGNDVPNIPLQATPSFSTRLHELETKDMGDQYGERISGYISAPASGSYTFMISGDDAAELWLSTDSIPANKKMIASFLSYTDYRQFNKFTSQTSAGITLQADHRYYFELLHKQGAGGDHVTVGWRLPDGAVQVPVPADRLSACLQTGTAGKANQTISFDPITGKTFGDVPFTISASATSGYPVSFRVISGLASVSGNTLTIGNIGTVTIEAVQEGDNNYNPAPAVVQSFTVAAPALPGKVEAEHFQAISGIIMEPCSEGTFDVGSLDAGDWMDYQVNVAEGGTYTFNFRVADPYYGGQLQVRNEAGGVLATVAVPNTGDWQVWTTVSAPVNLAAGLQTIRIYCSNGGWNLDWWQAVNGASPVVFTGKANPEPASAEPTAERISAIRAYPNPAYSECLLQLTGNYTGVVKVMITDMTSHTLKLLRLTKTRQQLQQKISLAGLPAGNYIIHAQLGTKHQQLMIVKVSEP